MKPSQPCGFFFDQTWVKRTAYKIALLSFVLCLRVPDVLVTKALAALAYLLRRRSAPTSCCVCLSVTGQWILLYLVLSQFYPPQPPSIASGHILNLWLLLKRMALISHYFSLCLKSLPRVVSLMWAADIIYGRLHIREIWENENTFKPGSVSY